MTGNKELSFSNAGVGDLFISKIPSHGSFFVLGIWAAGKYNRFGQMLYVVEVWNLGLQEKDTYSNTCVASGKLCFPGDVVFPEEIWPGKEYTRVRLEKMEPHDE
jgi:hypothetical protein